MGMCRVAIRSPVLEDNYFYGSSASNYLWWDASASKLEARQAYMRFGTLSSTTAGSGVILSSSNTRVIDVNADDNNTAIGSAVTVRCIAGRFMNYNSPQAETWGIHGMCKLSAVARTANVAAGVVGAFESTGTCSTATGSGNTFVAGVMGRLGLGSGFTLGAGTYACGVLAFYNTASASDPTGEYTCAFMATASDIAGVDDWDYGVYIEDTARAWYSTTTLAGSSALNNAEFTVSDTTTPASGYAHGIHVTYNKSGVDTGSGCSTMQFNAIGADVTISGAGGGTAGYYSLYTYVAKSGTPDLSGCAIFGANLEMTEMGATDYFGGLWINKYNTTKGTGIDAFILCSNQASGVTTAVIYVQGTKPDYFLQCASADGFWDSGTGATSGCSGHIEVRVGSTSHYLRTYSSAS